VLIMALKACAKSSCMSVYPHTAIMPMSQCMSLACCDSMSEKSPQMKSGIV
jgi:hypothetical protein